MRTLETRCTTVNQMRAKCLVRIKSPQLYQLSYRPKYLQTHVNRRASLGPPESIVSPVYPHRILDVYHGGAVKAPALYPGQRVRVTEGLARGQVGEVVHRVSWDFAPGVPQYAVVLASGLRPMRADYLEVVT